MIKLALGLAVLLFISGCILDLPQNSGFSSGHSGPAQHRGDSSSDSRS